jgi:hypothetical protein
MAGYGYGISVSGSRTPVVASITPAPTTLPLSTPVIYINGRQLNKVGNQWVSDYPFETLSYGTPFDVGWNYTIEIDYEPALASSNAADGTAIPLLGWSPPITITTP